MALKDIADALVAGCRSGTEAANLDVLYDRHAISVEALEHGNGRVTEGLEGIRGKHVWFEQAFEVLEQTVSDPFLHGDDRFAVIFDVTAKNRETKEVAPMKEIAIYHVADGKIFKEEFFQAV